MDHNKHNRWIIALMGTLLQMVMGTVYAWSFFQKPIMAAHGWSNVQVMWIFSIAIVFLGLTAAAGGFILPRLGPQKLAISGVILYSLGYLISSHALTVGNIYILYLGFGVIGGMGLGLGYVVPVTTVAKWFPDKKGLITGMVIMGFGFGALLMSKFIAPSLPGMAKGEIGSVFAWTALILFLMGLPAALFMRNPHASDLAGTASSDSAIASKDQQHTIRNIFVTRKFWSLWILFFCNISAGIIFIGWQSPMFQDLLRIYRPVLNSASLATAGATLIAVSSLFNGAGRMLWGGISDKIGRIKTFRLIISSQMVVFILLMFTSNPWVFAVLVCYVLLCYGGGFGTMPAFVLDVFGSRMMPLVYGSLLTAWSIGGIAGPQIAAWIKDNFAQTAAVYIFIAAIILLSIGLIVSFTINDKSIPASKETNK